MTPSERLKEIEAKLSEAINKLKNCHDIILEASNVILSKELRSEAKKIERYLDSYSKSNENVGEEK